MVWGLRFESSFGQFFPEGDYVSWDKSLAEGFKTKLTEAEQQAQKASGTSYVYNARQKFIRDLGPVADHEWPAEFRIRRLPKKLGALMHLNDRILVVADALKAIIDRLEPGIHQFRPILFSDAKGNTVSDAYHVMVIRQHLDALDPEASTAGSLRKSEAGHYRASQPNAAVYAGIALTADRIAGKHLWQDQRLKDPEIFFSDALRAAIQAADLLLPKMHALKDTSAPPTVGPPETLAPWGSKDWVEFHYQTSKDRPATQVPKGSVWGIFEPTGFSAFCPEGHFPGWEAALEKRAEAGQIWPPKDPSEPIGALSGRIAEKFEADVQRLEPHECPDTFATGWEMSRFPSLIRLNGSISKSAQGLPQHPRPLVVDAALKDIIEELEPDTHQFWPIRFLMGKDGTELAQSMFGLGIRNHLDAFRPEQSRAGSFRRGSSGAAFATSESKSVCAGLAISVDASSPVHLWRDRTLRKPGIFMSSTLMARIAAEGLLIPLHLKMKVV
jgi:hypothetical protein